MAELPNWGSLQKSQDDPETIEEAIARIVGEHDDDPMSHNDEGQALQSHKSFEVLDHPAGSVVADKNSARDIVYPIYFNTLDGFNHTPTYASVNELRLVLEVESAHPASSVSCVPLQENFLGNEPQSLVVQSPLAFLFGEGTTAVLNWVFMGFEIENTRVRGANIYESEFTDWYSVDMTQMHTLRAVYFKSQEKIKFFVDGVQIGELDYEWVPSSGDMTIEIVHTRGSGNDDILNAANLYFGVFFDEPPA